MISVVLIDDEPPARRKLRHLLAREADIRILGEAACGTEAIAVLDEHRPDIAFLDIQLPDCTGFDVVEALQPREGMNLVFVTAFDEFAVRAFEVQAVDYLLKPVEPSRFADSLQRIRDKLQRGETRNELQRASSAGALLRALSAYSQRLLIQEAERSLFLEVNRIDWIESARNYVCIHSGGVTYVMRSSLEALTARLDPAIFRRIGKSEVVNQNRIRQIRPESHGDRIITLSDGVELRWSRRYRESSPEALE